MNIKDIEKEFDEEFAGAYGYCNHTMAGEIRSFYKAKINQVIDEMIGEKKKEESKLPEMGDEYIKVERENIGYNQKRAELKKYKEKFNK